MAMRPDAPRTSPAHCHMQNNEHPPDVTQLLSALGQGDSRAAADLLPIVYEELRRLARARMANEQVGQTLQPTALVHEAYMRLVARAEEQRWDSRGHFFAAAAESMRRILVERARHRARLRHGGGRRRVELHEDAMVSTDDDGAELLALNDAIDKLERHDPRKHRVVMLRYFGGLSIEETAAAMDLSPATIKNEWTIARAWLHRALNDSPAEDAAT